MQLRMIVLLAAVALCAVGKRYECDKNDREGRNYCPSVRKIGVQVSSGPGRMRTVMTGKGMGGWGDLRNSDITGLADYLVGIQVEIPPHKWGQGWELEFLCNDYTGRMRPGTSCTAVVFMYRCKPGCDTPNDLLATTTLWMDGWRHVPCAAWFVVDKTASRQYKHRLAAFHIEVKLHTAQLLTLHDDVEFMFWGMFYKSSTCMDHMTEDDCATCSDDCEWQHGTCVPRSCSGHAGPKPYGPIHPQCDLCIDDAGEQKLIKAQLR